MGNWELIGVGIFLGMWFMGAIWGITSAASHHTVLDQEVANDVCVKITGVDSIGSSEFGKLVCTTPSYDTSIIVRKMGEGVKQ